MHKRTGEFGCGLDGVCVQFRTARSRRPCYFHPMNDRDEIRRLILQIERGVLARAQLKVLVTAATSALTGHRRTLRVLQARVTNGMRARARSK